MLRAECAHATRCEMQRARYTSSVKGRRSADALPTCGCRSPVHNVVEAVQKQGDKRHFSTINCAFRGVTDLPYRSPLF